MTNLRLQKLGNTLVFLANNVGELSKTKILKLLFLLEESSVKKHATPMLGFKFYVWQYGPVLMDVFADLGEEEGPNLLGKFIHKNQFDPANYDPSREFNDDFFSDNEISLLEDIAKFAKHKTAKDLIYITHKPGSLWYDTAQRNGVLDALESKQQTTTDFIIDFSMLFEEDEVRKEHYADALENYLFIHQLKG